MRAQTMLRVAVATTVSVLTTVTALGPVHAAVQMNTDRDASTWGAVKSQESRGESVGSRSDATRPDHTDGNASTRGDVDGPQPESTADQKGGGANSYDCEEGPEGPYCGTDRTEDSANGKGDGEATGRPGAGTVGRADNKNPQGQEPGPEDGNRGYECDQPGDEPNQGIAEGNPAHTGCAEAADEEAPEETPEQEAPDREDSAHTEVTVCHVTGNGYIELTFDDSALEAHEGHGDLYPVPADGCPAEEAPEDGTPDDGTPDDGTPDGGEPDDGTPDDGEPDDGTPDEGENPDEGTPPAHTEVTVCHVTGDGYIELTFDDSALEAHVGHGDLYPVPAEGCPVEEAPVEGTPDDGTPDDGTPGGEGGGTPDDGTPGGEGGGDVEDGTPGGEGGGDVEDEVLGTEKDLTDEETMSPTDETSGANRAPATVAPAESAAPASGILPATGAGDYAPLLVGGALLLVAGGALLARRRLGADS